MSTSSPTSPFKIGIVIVSDRASKGVYEDRGGPAVESYLEEHFVAPLEIVRKIIPDEQAQIESTIKEFTSSCGFIVTTGGTGPSPRDVTTEATEAVCQKLLPGFGEVMRAVSFEKVPTAILSRQTAGICNSSLVVNLPGKPKAIAECMEPILLAIPYCIKLAGKWDGLKVKPEFQTKERRCIGSNNI